MPFRKKLHSLFESSFAKNRIKVKLLVYFLLMAFIPTSVIFAVLYSQSTDIIFKRIHHSLENNLNIVETNILQKLESINDISTYIYMNPELIRILSSGHPSDKIDIINEMSALDRMLQGFITSSVTKTVLNPAIYMYNRPEYSQFNFSGKVFDLGTIEREEWYRRLPAKSDYAIVGLFKSMRTNKNPYSIRVAKKLYGIHEPDVGYAALLTIDIGLQDFLDTLKSFKPVKDSRIFIIDKNASIVASPDLSLLGLDYSQDALVARILGDKSVYSSFIQKRDGMEVLTAYKKIVPLGWTIISISPTHELYGELLVLNRLAYIVIAITLVLGIVAALALSESVSHPIRKLVKSMSKVKDGNFDIQLVYKKNDEFSYLVQAYTSMVLRIKELIRQLYTSEATKREAEFKAMQAQINPHFLYNTLNSINWLAIKHQVPDISVMVTALSDFYRYGLSKGQNIIPLSDERKQVEGYLAIQKVRFQDKLFYEVDFSEEILSFVTVKLILQPLVENAILHGIEKRRGKGLILITGKKLGDSIELRVSDNGAGADTERMNALLAAEEMESSGYGIKNVNIRIRQYFGNTYGIHYECNDTGGVTAVIRIPALTTLEGYHAENDSSR